MNPSRPNQIENRKPSFKKIVLTALIVGTFDIFAAIILTLFHGNGPIRMLRYIASGVFGNAAFSGGAIFTFLGLLFHYLIAFLWTVLFFRSYSTIRKTIRNAILAGIAYGIFVWGAMNLVVLPLSNAFQGRITIFSTLSGILILISMIGLPLSFIADRLFSDKDKPDKAK